MPLPSTQNVGEWRIALAVHPDMPFVDHIEFGFPSNYSAARVTGAVAWLMRRQDFHTLVYVARQAFDYLRAICHRLGHRLTPDKCMALVPHIVRLGFEVCAER